MAEISDYNVSAGSNPSASPNGAPEGMAPGDVNDVIREVMARLKRWYNDTGGANDSAGSANAYTLAASQTISAYAEGQVFLFEASFANTGAATLNVDSVAPKSLEKNYNQALVSGDIFAGQMVLVVYEATADNFQIISVLQQVTGVGAFTSLTATGAFSSLGIDDNATGERLQISDTLITLGTASAGYGIVHAATDQSIEISGGST